MAGVTAEEGSPGCSVAVVSSASSAGGKAVYGWEGLGRWGVEGWEPVLLSTDGGGCWGPVGGGDRESWGGVEGG